MNHEQFQAACTALRQRRQDPNSIGTLGEKSLHWVVKHYLQPDPAHHEAAIGPYVADIFDERGILEIQTRNFDQLRQKLDFFLPQYPVTVVYPIAARKQLLWQDETTGHISSSRRSPKRGSIHEVFPELYRIKGWLHHPHLRLHLILMDLEEYRYLNGWGRGGKRGSSRADRIPVKLVEEVLLQDPRDFVLFLPESLPETFTSADFKTAAKVSLRLAQVALNILHHMGAVVRCGRQGRSYLYQLGEEGISAHHGEEKN